MTDVVPNQRSEPTAADESSRGGAPWTVVCPVDRVVPDRGVAALVTDADGAQVPVAVFRLSPPVDGAESVEDSESRAAEPVDRSTGHEWYAVSHLDPATGAPVMARGLVGSAGGPSEPVPTLAAPLHKQRYNLRTGACLDDDELELATFEVRVVEGRVEVRP